jgi:hypothetical protein
MPPTTAEEVYEQVVRDLPGPEQLRLVERIARGLSQGAENGAASTPAERYDWMSVRGIAPDLMQGEDAQEWVSRSRREADESRERQWRRDG